MLNRRTFTASALMSACLAQREACAQGVPRFFPSLESLFRPPSSGEETTETGNGPAPGVDICKAFQIAMKAPRDVAPVDVANYFNKNDTKSATAILDPKTGAKATRYFREEWPTPGPTNPLIVDFFATTQLLPSGDQTAWCAAFINFCLFTAGKQGTTSASSQSFKPLATISPETAPITGNIACFEDLNASGVATGFGHVGFCLDPADVLSGKYPARAQVLETYKSNPKAYLLSLGGNQAGADAGSTGGVKVAALPRNAKTFRLIGFVDIQHFKEIPA